MLNRVGVAAFLLACVFVVHATPMRAQASDAVPPGQAQKPSLTIHTTAQIVLTDVVVTDGKGNPVQGLKESDFHIYDNGRPQTMLSFKEYRTESVANALPSVSAAPDVYSNAFIEHLPPVLNIVVIDTTDMEVSDQMYLRYELDRFIKQLPSGEPIAVYWRTAGTSLLLQNFTADHAQLLDAVHKAVPHIWPFGREGYSYISTLERIAIDFGQYPGRKNVLWLTGSTLPTVMQDPGDLSSDVWADPGAIHNVYDLLQASRIAIYPMDVRGLMIALRKSEQNALYQEHWEMTNVAEATGGHAYYNNNGLDVMTEQWLKSSGDFYTITYSPPDETISNKWHTVKVKLDKSLHKYHVSYRRGYFADGTIRRKREAEKLRAMLLASGNSVKQPDLRGEPIIFQAEVRPAAEMTGDPVAANDPSSAKPQRGMVPYMIRYQLPSKYFGTAVLHGKTELVLGVSAIAFNGHGSAVAHDADQLTFKLHPQMLRENPEYVIKIDQYVDLPEGQSYLSLAVWDVFTRRVGTLQIPMQVVDPQKAK